MKNLKTTIKMEILERLQDGELEGIEISDAMYHLYNTEYYIDYTDQAKQFIKDNIDELFEALEDYQLNFGEVYLDITNPQKLASLTALHVAETLWNELDTVQDNWNRKIWEDIALYNKLVEELQA